MDEYNVSRTTIRKAINNLVNEGYCYTIHGKGIFVQEKKFTQGLVKLTSCSEDIIRRGYKPSADVLDLSKIKPTRKIAANLKLAENESVILLERIRYAGNEPINVTKSYLPFKYFPEVMNQDFTDMSLYNFLQDHYKVEFIKAIRTIDASLVDEVYSKLLKMEEGSPFLVFTGIVYGKVNGEEIPIEYFKSHFKSDKFKFYIEQVP